MVIRQQKWLKLFFLFLFCAFWFTSKLVLLFGTYSVKFVQLIYANITQVFNTKEKLKKKIENDKSYLHGCRQQIFNSISIAYSYIDKWGHTFSLSCIISSGKKLDFECTQRNKTHILFIDWLLECLLRKFFVFLKFWFIVSLFHFYWHSF